MTTIRDKLIAAEGEGVSSLLLGRVAKLRASGETGVRELALRRYLVTIDLDARRVTIEDEREIEPAYSLSLHELTEMLREPTEPGRTAS